MKIHLWKILHMKIYRIAVFAKFRLAKFDQEDRVFDDLSLELGSA